MLNIIILTICFIALVAAAYTDIRTREVPDWINYSLIFAGLGIRSLYSMINMDYTFILNGVLGLSFFLALAFLMYYAGQWGGGDSKLLMGLGAMLGLEFGKFSFLIIFLVHLLLVGALYGLLWTFVLSVIRWKQFSKTFKEMIMKKIFIRIQKYLFSISLIIALLTIFINDFLLRLFMLTFIILIITTFYVWLFVKSIEKSCMIRSISPLKLTEGDWIAKEIRYRKKLITGPKDLGISKAQINTLIKLYKQKKIKKVLIKDGIPFVPSFLIAFIISLIFGGWFLVLI